MLRSHNRSLWAAFGNALWAHQVYVAVLALSAFTAIGLDLSGRAPGMARPLYITAYYYVAVGLLVPYALAIAVIWHRIQHRLPWGVAWRSCRKTVATNERLAHFGVAIVGVRVLLMAAVAWKCAIPVLHPFAFDVQLSQLDAWLHGGRHPWEYLAWLYRHPTAMAWLDWFYPTWFSLFGLLVVWQGWRLPSVHRTRFFIALALTWVVLGNGVATLVSSAGPAYYASVTGLVSPYASQMAQLGEMHLVAQKFQSALWRAHLSGPDSIVRGIAAFPSLHVAIPALATIALWRSSRPLAVLFGLDTTLTLLCSVLLGWHYAVDGYVSILSVTVIWWLAGKLAGREPALPPRMIPARQPVIAAAESQRPA